MRRFINRNIYKLALITTALTLAAGLASVSAESETKLYVVIYQGTDVGGYAGPVPYGIKECAERVNLFEGARRDALRSGRGANGIRIPAKNMRIIEKMRFYCEWRRSAPDVQEMDMP